MQLHTKLTESHGMCLHHFQSRLVPEEEAVDRDEEELSPPLATITGSDSRPQRRHSSNHDSNITKNSNSNISNSYNADSKWQKKIDDILNIYQNQTTATTTPTVTTSINKTTRMAKKPNGNDEHGRSNNGVGDSVVNSIMNGTRSDRSRKQLSNKNYANNGKSPAVDNPMKNSGTKQGQRHRQMRRHSMEGSFNYVTSSASSSKNFPSSCAIKDGAARVGGVDTDADRYPLKEVSSKEKVTVEEREDRKDFFSSETSLRFQRTSSPYRRRSSTSSATSACSVRASLTTANANTNAANIASLTANDSTAAAISNMHADIMQADNVSKFTTEAPPTATIATHDDDDDDNKANSSLRKNQRANKFRSFWGERIREYQQQKQENEQKHHLHKQRTSIATATTSATSAATTTATSNKNFDDSLSSLDNSSLSLLFYQSMTNSLEHSTPGIAAANATMDSVTATVTPRATTAANFNVSEPLLFTSSTDKRKFSTTSRPSKSRNIVQQNRRRRLTCSDAVRPVLGIGAKEDIHVKQVVDKYLVDAEKRVRDERCRGATDESEAQLQHQQYRQQRRMSKEPLPRAGNEKTKQDDLRGSALLYKQNRRFSDLDISHQPPLANITICIGGDENDKKKNHSTDKELFINLNQVIKDYSSFLTDDQRLCSSSESILEPTRASKIASYNGNKTSKKTSKKERIQKTTTVVNVSSNFTDSITSTAAQAAYYINDSFVRENEGYNPPIPGVVSIDEVNAAFCNEGSKERQKQPRYMVAKDARNDMPPSEHREHATKKNEKGIRHYTALSSRQVNHHLTHKENGNKNNQIRHKSKPAGTPCDVQRPISSKSLPKAKASFRRHSVDFRVHPVSSPVVEIPAKLSYHDQHIQANRDDSCFVQSECHIDRVDKDGDKDYRAHGQQSKALTSRNTKPCRRFSMDCVMDKHQTKHCGLEGGVNPFAYF